MLIPLVCCGLLLPGLAWGTDAASKPAPAPAAQKAGQKPARQPLEKGMTAEQILALIGKPAEVKPIEAPKGLQGPAEIWVYRRTMGTQTVQYPTGERDVPVYGGIGADQTMKTRKELIYTLKHVTVYRVTSLLMVDGRLVLARQSQEQSDVYD